MPVMDFGDALNLALKEEMRRDGRVYCIGEDIVLGVPFGVTKGLGRGVWSRAGAQCAHL